MNVSKYNESTPTQTSAQTYFDGMENVTSKESILKTERIKKIEKSLENLETSMQWTVHMLSHHFVSQRSICFVMDSNFEHIK